MTTIWRNGHFLAPSIERFLDLLTDDLQRGRSLVVVLPNGTKPAELQRALTQRLGARGSDTVTLRLTEVESITHAIQELAPYLQVEWQPAKIPRTVDNLLRLRMAQYASEEIVLFFEGLDRISEEARSIWLELLTRWSNATHTIANTTIPIVALCLIDQADILLTQLPDSMLYLQLHWWWGLPSRIEVQLYCHSLLEPGEETEAKLWREYLLPHLVGDDVALLRYLWDKLFDEPAGLSPQLANYAKTRWSDEQALECEPLLQAWQARHPGNSFQPQPPPEYRKLWANGILTLSTEYGIELHPAMAAQLGSHQTISHRLWRGQAALLLPLLDQIRLTLCSYFTQKYGDCWPLCWGEPSGEEREYLRENPHACEWRFLRNTLEYGPVPKEERQFVPLAKQGLAIRNCLAHYQPISYIAFQRFWREQKLLDEQM